MLSRQRGAVLHEGPRDQQEQAGQEENKSQPFKEVRKEVRHLFSSLSELQNPSLSLFFHNRFFWESRK
jgi:hypothetical protein